MEKKKRTETNPNRLAVEPAHLKKCWSKKWIISPNFQGKDKKHLVFPKIGVPQNGWFIMENPIKTDDLGVPLFSEAPI